MPRRSAARPALLVTAEHGGRRVPPAYRPLFARHAVLLDTHRASDPGSLAMARTLASHLGAPLLHSTITRLLVDLNRSRGHPRLFSEVTRDLPRAGRERILTRFYHPYRDAVGRRVAALAARGRVVHVASHSFVPELHGEVRNADIGLLYDPRRRGERTLAARWRAALRQLEPGLRVRCNYPYAGRADGLTTHLRRAFPDRRYAGLELEINQRFPLQGGRDWARLRRTVAAALEIALR